MQFNKKRIKMEKDHHSLEVVEEEAHLIKVYLTA